MISIRSQLLCWLLPGFAAICIIAGFGIYYSTRVDLEAKLDAQLEELTDDVRIPPAALRVRRIAAENDMVLDVLPDDVYGEIWIGLRGLHQKTSNLKKSFIPKPDKFKEKAAFYDTQLKNGATVRVRAERIVVAPNLNTRILIAVDRSGLDKTLTALSAQLIIGGCICCLLLSILLALALHTALRPLRKLGNQAAGMNAESLHERFSEKNAPADIRPIVEHLNLLMEKLENSFSRERRFSSNLAHELSTPLAAIRATGEVAAKWPEQASTEDFLEITRLAVGLQQTLDSLLLLARMESSKAERITETVQLATIVNECRMLHHSKAQTRGLTWELRIDETATIETDPRLLQIIVSNLIANAVEYAPENSEITLSAVGNGEAIFRCINEAPALSQRDIPLLTERLWRKNAVRTESGHVGLGLSIADSCAKALGYRLSIELSVEKRICISIEEE